MQIDIDRDTLQRRPSRWAAGLFLGIALLIYAIVFAEFFLRFVEPAPLLPRYVTAAPYGVRMNIPNSVYWQTTPETHVEFRINSQGIRADHDYPIQKPPGTCRVLMLGDSFFMGYEVDLKDSLQDRLERSLRRDGYPCDVINLAVSGFGTAESLVALKNFGLQFSPDIVLLELHRTNLDNNIRSGLFHLDDGKLVPGNTSYLPGIKLSDRLMQSSIYRWLVENSQLYSALRERISMLAKSLIVFVKTGVMDAANGTGGDNPRFLAEKRALNLALVKAIQDSLDPKTRLLMVEIPDRQSRMQFTSFKPIGDGDQEYIKTGQYISVLDDLRAAARPDLKLYSEMGQGHLTPAGVEIVAKKVVATIEATPELQDYRKPPNPAESASP